MTLEVRKRSGSSHELGETSANVASGARLAVDPPVMAYIDQYLRFWMAVDGMPTMSDPHWVADFNKLVVSVCLPRHPSGTWANLCAVPATCPVRFRWVVTLLRGPKVESTLRSLTSREIMSPRSGPAAFLRCFLAVPLDANMTVLSRLTFIPLSSKASHVITNVLTSVVAALWSPALKSHQSSTYVRRCAGLPSGYPWGTIISRPGAQRRGQ
eukprot:1465234-Heterocapsa_arctica.AAC.1